MKAKEPSMPFGEETKEPIIERVFQLVDRYPSRSAAARAWGININTLKNYYTRRDIEPVPRKNQLVKIAKTEDVSLDWLLYGINDEINNEFKQISPDKTGGDVVKKEPKDDSLKTSSDKLTELLSLLDDDEKNRLYEVIARKGVDTILQLIFEFAALSPAEFERVIRLAKQVREGAIDGSSENDVTNPTRRQVG